MNIAPPNWIPCKSQVDRLWQKYQSRLGPHTFARHALTISSGIAFAQAIQVLVTPIITRIYSPAEFGTAAAIGSAAGILTVFSTLRFENAIPLAHTRKEAHRLATLSNLFAIITSILVTLFLLTAPPTALRWCGLPTKNPWLLWSLPLLVFAGGIQFVTGQLGTAAKAYKAIGLANATQATFSTVFKVLVGLWTPTATVIIIGELFRRTIGISLTARAANYNLARFFGQLRLKPLLATMRRHRRYPLFSLPAAVLYNISLQAPILVLSATYSQAVSGLFAVAMSCVQAPATLISSGVANAFSARLREREKQGTLVPFVTSFIRGMAVVGAPWFAICMAWGPELIGAVFSAKWRDSGVYLAILTPWLFISFTNPGTVLLNLRNKQSRDLPWHVAFVVIRLGGLYVVSRYLGPLYAITFFAAASFLLLGAYSYWLLRTVYVPIRPTLLFSIQELAAYALPSVLLAAAARLCHCTGLRLVIPVIILTAAIAVYRIARFFAHATTTTHR
ncbi:MAG: lipopolysaccharide biosynthesis protein [Verrucomicrobiota bacterium]